MSGRVRDLVSEVRMRLRAVADPARAAGQQAYMKSAMPFLGVRVPEARRVSRAAASGADPDTLRQAALELWAEATHREERYAALALLGMPVLRGDLTLLPLIERMVREGQWWDITDELAHRLGDLLDAHPAELDPLLRRWARDPDHWIRRIAILGQLDRGARTDSELLEDVIAPNVADREFFIRKGIGWALRQYARVAPEWVREFVRRYEVSALTRREALKHIGPGAGSG